MKDKLCRFLFCEILEAKLPKRLELLIRKFAAAAAAQLLRYAELRSALELSPTQMSEYFKVKSVQGQSSQGKAP